MLHVNFFGLALAVPEVLIILDSPWEAKSLECRLFTAVTAALKPRSEKSPGKWEVRITDPESWQKVLQAIDRVLRGWQEDADASEGETRWWRWELDASTDVDDYGRPKAFTFVGATIILEPGHSCPEHGETGREVELDSLRFVFQLPPGNES